MHWPVAVDAGVGTLATSTTCGTHCGEAEVAHLHRRASMAPFPGSRSTFAKILLLATAMAGGQASAAAIHGALFTTDIDGNVNVNQYESKAAVYLDGGPPPNAPCTAAGLDDGTYVYQITNPSGTVLLSSDDISHRTFVVSGGVIVSASDHPTVTGTCPGAVAVQMAPFEDTPNNGGVYKAWVTRQSDYVANSGFSPGSTKTDNFRVMLPAVTPETADLNVYKFYDANANGIWDSTEVPLFGWAMRVTNGAALDSTQLTLSPDGLATWHGLSVANNPYTVTEGTAGGTWHQSASIVNGVPTLNSPENPVSGLALTVNQTTEVDFGNYCTCNSGGKGIAFWTSTAGQTKLNDGVGMASEFKLLNGAYLRRSNGLHFDLILTTIEPTNYTLLSAWLLGGAASTNVAYTLATQLAAMKLNVEAGYVNTANFYKPYGGTIAQLIIDANALLSNSGCAATCNPASGSQLANDMTTLTADLADLNANATVIKPKACAFTFKAL
ncbi:MAG: hypothetical protein ACJ8GK_01395 [Luteimonas sp.]